jgi:GUN4-like/CHAT domain
MSKMKILFLAADPTDSTRLRLGQELRDIREKLQLSKLRDDFDLESRESVRPGDITQAIFDIEPHVVHFSGHGTKTGELIFEDVLGKAQPVSPAALASLFDLIAGQVGCVILNACYSETQAKAIAEYIPFVIGMNKAIGDKAAIAFATGFYKALGAGRSFEDAYRFACVEIQLQGIPEHLTPALLRKSNEQNGFNGMRSACGINYNRLQTLLDSGNWKEANQETTKLLIKISGRERLGPLDSPNAIGTLGDRDIEALPCQDLLIIDTLWSKYSGGRFGFTAQTKILQKIENSQDVWAEFCLIVEWFDEKLTYALYSPIGHLPTPPLHFTSSEGIDYNNNIDKAYWWNIATILDRFRECIVYFEAEYMANKPAAPERM